MSLRFEGWLPELRAWFKPLPKARDIFMVKCPPGTSNETVGYLTEQLDPLRSKYGIDFIVLGPGVTVERMVHD